MLKLHDIQDNKLFPKFIRNNSVFEHQSKKIKKVFPDIGLSNCSVPLDELNFNVRIPKSYRDKNLKLVFSSNNFKGAWDLATMAMRGIRSCQSWTDSYRSKLVGSIVDPYVGIIYLTNNNLLSHGTRMMRRALVRFVVHRESLEPKLLLEEIYPNRNDYSRKSRFARKVFKRFLMQKTGGNYLILTDDDDLDKYLIPKSKIVKRLSVEDRSYRDSSISYSKHSVYNF